MGKFLLHEVQKLNLRSVPFENAISGKLLATGKVMKLKAIPGILILFWLFSFVAVAQEVATTPIATPPSATTPQLSKPEIEEYMRTAKVVRSKWLGVGVANPRKLYLDNGKIQHPAVFKSIEERRFGVSKLAGSVEYDFKDSWKFEVAAYELDKLLGLDMIPPTVERTFEGEKGSLQWWIDNAMTEDDRLKKKLMPPDAMAWAHQRAKMDIFDVLIYNIDRNQGNLLITDIWRMFLIDHSRSFKSIDMVKKLDQIAYFSRSLMEGFRKLDQKAVTENCKKWLTGAEIKTMMKRRDLIVAYYDKLLAEKGESITFP